MKAALLIGLSFWAAAVAAEPAAPAVLILPFDSGGTNEGQNVPDLLAAFLSPIESRVRLVERERWEEIFREKAFQATGLTDQRARYVAKLAGAQYLLRGSVLLRGGRVEIRGLLYETETTRLVKSFEATDAAGRVAPAVENLAGRVAVFFSAPLKPLPRLPADPNPEVNRLLIQGLGHYYQGQYPRAYAAFLKIRGLDPRNADAAYWLGKSFWDGGLPDHAREAFEEFVKTFPTDRRGPEIRRWLQDHGTPKDSSGSRVQ